MLRINKIASFLDICKWGDRGMGYLGNYVVVKEVKVFVGI